VERLNDKLLTSLLRAMAGQAREVPTEPRLCLAFVRAVIDDALDGPRSVAYDRYLVAGTTQRGNDAAANLREAQRDPWAADFEYHVRTDSLWPDNPEGNPVVVTRYGTDLPAEANVKEGVTYGPAGNYEGTLRVSDSASLADIAAVTGAQIAAATNKDA